MARQPLGRGLSALMGDDNPATGSAVNMEIDIDLIEPNPEQPRTRFAEADLEELTQSIRANGVIQPIVVRKVGGRYQIVAGERRWRAAQRAELHRIPANVKEVSDEKMLELALVENIQRHDLNPIEEAAAYRKLIDTIGLTQDEAAERVGKERSVITTLLRLLKLPGEIQRAIEESQLTAGHGRALLVADDPKVQRAAANAAIDKGWSVRETEKEVRRLATRSAAGKKQHRVRPELDANVKAAEVRLKRALNTNVKILPARKGAGGKIEVEYYSTDDLDRIFQVLVKK
jgi:ParB family transcriptional regulator, chromosome partitioning protein